ncbi:MAG: hypothetical protein GY847_29745 [Proteobacteria bacterium]|nr:hypothetical protein [Pseudomonadota bacterium]
MKYAKKSLFLWHFFLVLAIGMVGCEKEDTVIPGGYSDGDSDSDSDSDSDADGDDDGADEGSKCLMENYTQSCCDGYGVQVCEADLTWSECDCGGPGPGEDGGVGPDDERELDSDFVPEGNEDTEIIFEWEERDSDEVIPGECKAGLYLGNFDGTYERKGGVLPFGEDGGVDVSGVYPGVTIRINKSTNGEVFTVSDGVFYGNAFFIFTFRAKMEGELDCPTAKLRGKIIDGSYSYPVAMRHGFEGSYEADYDKKTHSFKNGRWRVYEPKYPTQNGGWGSWHAKFTRP